MARPNRSYLRRPLLLGIVAAAMLGIAPDAPAIDSSLLRAEHLLRKGLASLERGELDLAQGAFLRARSAAPELPQPEIMLGHVEMLRGNYPEAESAYLEAVRRFRQLTGRMRVESERRSRQILDRVDEIAIQVDSVSGSANGSQSMAEARSLQLQARAISLRRQAAEVKSTLGPATVPPELFFFLGNARLSAGRPDLAAESFGDAIEMSRNEPRFHYHLAVALATAGRADEAMVVCVEAARLGHNGAAQLQARIRAMLEGVEEDAASDGPRVVLVP